MAPKIDLILSPAETPGRCEICGHARTDLWCESCNPGHYLCRGCIASHRDDFNAVVGQEPEVGV